MTADRAITNTMDSLLANAEHRRRVARKRTSRRNSYEAFRLVVRLWGLEFRLVLTVKDNRKVAGAGAGTAEAPATSKVYEMPFA